ncbi:ERCC4 domain-containing protein [Thermodesulfobacteriota bacterium]
MDKRNKPITIIADDREPRNEVIRSLMALENVSVHIKRLAVGDYKADNRIIFERKTLNDFAISIIDGRLFNQMIRLARENSKGVLIIEGTGKDLAQVGVRREAMQGALITISLLLGIPVLRSKDSPETAKLIVYAARQIKSLAKGGFQRHSYQPKGKRKRGLFILQGLPRVGRERASRLLDAFGSVEAVVTASSDELQSVEGIGKNIADRIVWAVREQVDPYGIIDVFPI